MSSHPAEAATRENGALIKRLQNVRDKSRPELMATGSRYNLSVITHELLNEAIAALSTQRNGVDQWYLGTLNDGLFIINKPPRPSSEDAWHDRPDGPSLAISVSGLGVARAQSIVTAHNAALSTHQQQGAEKIANPNFLSQEIFKEARAAFIEHNENPPMTGEMWDFKDFVVVASYNAALSRAPQPGRIVSEDELLAALNATQPDTVTEEMVRVAAKASYEDWIEPISSLEPSWDELPEDFKDRFYGASRAALTAALAARKTI